jgi:hypothetical protein
MAKRGDEDRYAFAVRALLDGSEADGLAVLTDAFQRMVAAEHEVRAAKERADAAVASSEARCTAMSEALDARAAAGKLRVACLRDLREAVLLAANGVQAALALALVVASQYTLWSDWRHIIGTRLVTGLLVTGVLLMLISVLGMCGSAPCGRYTWKRRLMLLVYVVTTAVLVLFELGVTIAVVGQAAGLDAMQASGTGGASVGEAQVAMDVAMRTELERAAIAGGCSTARSPANATGARTSETGAVLLTCSDPSGSMLWFQDFATENCGVEPPTLVLGPGFASCVAVAGASHSTVSGDLFCSCRYAMATRLSSIVTPLAVLSVVMTALQMLLLATAAHLLCGNGAMVAGSRGDEPAPGGSSTTPKATVGDAVANKKEKKMVV